MCKLTGYQTFQQDFSRRAWDPKVQIPYKVDSGQTPRKLEIERRRRLYLSKKFDQLLEEMNVSTQDLMPVADHVSKALTSYSEQGQPLPVFPSFLPLEVFDNTEFDCRTPEEWVALGKEAVSLDCVQTLHLGENGFSE